eukprot:349632-Chlamydomonas_euryale.AAC.40
MSHACRDRLTGHEAGGLHGDTPPGDSCPFSGRVERTVTGTGAAATFPVTCVRALRPFGCVDLLRRAPPLSALGGANSNVSASACSSCFVAASQSEPPSVLLPPHEVSPTHKPSSAAAASCSPTPSDAPWILADGPDVVGSGSDFNPRDMRWRGTAAGSGSGECDCDGDTSASSEDASVRWRRARLCPRGPDPSSAVLLRQGTASEFARRSSTGASVWRTVCERSLERMPSAKEPFAATLIFNIITLRDSRPPPASHGAYTVNTC